MIFLNQVLANYSQKAKCSLMPVFVNNVALEHSHAHSFIYCVWWLSCQNNPVE